jgi:cellulose synthase/poly-beta-1,6-N-acetylglucosamine synthase-like glycosyltransferase/spore germination protein YaaH/peptidoglycan/xylan/chitin deacetylase (PgdA/CDA1 family)
MNHFFPLQRNIHRLNLVVPEWFFIDPTADTVSTAIDDRGLAVMKNAGVAIMPMLSNFYSGDKKFHGESVHRILHDPAKKQRLISDLVRLVKQHGFSGINVDLEELQEKSDEAFVSFQKELHHAMKQQGFLVSQDVIPFNADYNYKALAEYNDYIFLMAYDEFSKSSKPGPVAEQKWIEAVVDDAVKKIPASRIILGMAAYGYDWPVEEEKNPGDVQVLTYRDALAVAKESQASIDFDNDTYNLHFSYYDDDHIAHEAYFTDAATTFNTLRFATESGIAGVALWRLGSEDDRLWKFYARNMSKDSISSFDFSDFGRISSPDPVAYSGAGEVLDILATPRRGSIRPEIDSVSLLIAEENYDSLPVSFIAKKFGWNGSDTVRNRKKLVLTFDDGPDPTWTPEILDILKGKNIPASFFLVGLNAENNIPLVRRIYREGHEIGDHTFTHPNIAEVSHRRAVVEMETTRLLIECITGHSTVLFRAPYNADFTPEKLEELEPVAIARTRNYLDVGESIDPLDWEPQVNADSIFNRVVRIKAALERDERSNTGGNIILLHDAGGNSRKATVLALPRIIDYFRSRGYNFTTIADLLGKKKDELMPPVPKGSGYYLLQANYFLFTLTYWSGHVLFLLFSIFIILSILRTMVMGALAIAQKKKEKKALLIPPFSNSYPAVSIIVPAYNEELNAVSSLTNLLKTGYPNFNIIFVDDGSRDGSFEKVREAFGTDERVLVLTKPNGGKASALNFGLEHTTADFVVCIDADTLLQPDAVSLLMAHFLRDSEGNTGAVAGNVKVGNEVNMLTRWQAIEYISSQNFDRRAFAFLNAVTVVPGAIGAFRKEAVEKAGGFTSDTLAEDCDLTIRIIRAGYLIKNESKALAFTEAPEKIGQFMKQRSRWSFGILQTFWKHRRILFQKKYRWLGWMAMPNILVFQYIIPFFIPLADIFLVLGIITGSGAVVFPYYLAFLLFDALVALMAFRMEKENIKRLIWLFPSG